MAYGPPSPGACRCPCTNCCNGKNICIWVRWEGATGDYASLNDKVHRFRTLNWAIDAGGRGCHHSGETGLWFPLIPKFCNEVPCHDDDPADSTGACGWTIPGTNLRFWAGLTKRANEQAKLYVVLSSVNASAPWVCTHKLTAEYTFTELPIDCENFPDLADNDFQPMTVTADDDEFEDVTLIEFALRDNCDDYGGGDQCCASKDMSASSYWIDITKNGAPWHSATIVWQFDLSVGWQLGNFGGDVPIIISCNSMTPADTVQLEFSDETTCMDFGTILSCEPFHATGSLTCNGHTYTYEIGQS